MLVAMLTTPDLRAPALATQKCLVGYVITARPIYAYIEKIERQASITEKRSIQVVKGKEALESGREKVTTLINEKLCDEALPKPILQLIKKPWSAFLAYTLLRHGDESTQWIEKNMSFFGSLYFN